MAATPPASGSVPPALESTTSSTEPEIDSALQAALREPRERMSLLKLEQAVFDFVNSSASWLEVGGLGNAIVMGPSVTQQIPIPPDYRPATSFQRCICHRLADRFSILRENGVLLEGSIRLIKTPESRIPVVLLRNIDTSAYDTQQQLPQQTPATMMTSENPMMLLSNNANNEGSKRPKMKLMKRKDSNSSAAANLKQQQSKSNQLLLQKSTLTDKERAYEEARARIFGDESEQADGQEDASNSIIDGTSDLHISVSASDLAGSSRDHNNSSTNLENKAVYRNRLEEAADPDFQRGRSVVYPVAAAAHNTPSQAQTPSYAPAVAVAPYHPVLTPASVIMYSSPASGMMTDQGGHFPPLMGHVAGAAPHATTIANGAAKSTDLTADAPAFYPYGQPMG